VLRNEWLVPLTNCSKALKTLKLLGQSRQKQRLRGAFFEVCTILGAASPEKRWVGRLWPGRPISACDHESIVRQTGVIIGKVGKGI
jgi:hypothetical protein